jgi:hypothetical protein
VIKLPNDKQLLLSKTQISESLRMIRDRLTFGFSKNLSKPWRTSTIWAGRSSERAVI